MATLYDNLILSLGHFLWQGVALSMVVAILLKGYRNPQDRYVALVGGLFVLLALPIVNFAILSAVPHRLVIRLGGELIQQFDARQLVLGLWAMGAVLSLSRYPLAWLKLHRMLKQRTRRASTFLIDRVRTVARELGFRRYIRVLEAVEDFGPATFGIIKHVLVVPASLMSRLSREQFEAGLAHEIPHMARQDFLVSLVQGLVESVLFFHPAVWWISAQIRKEREHCCDDLAVRYVGSPKVYANALLRLVEGPQPALAVAATGGSLLQRVRRLRIQRLSHEPRISLSAISVVLMLLLSALAVGVWAAPGKQSNGAAFVKAKELLLKGEPLSIAKKSTVMFMRSSVSPAQYDVLLPSQAAMSPVLTLERVDSIRMVKVQNPRPTMYQATYVVVTTRSDDGGDEQVTETSYGPTSSVETSGTSQTSQSSSSSSASGDWSQSSSSSSSGVWGASSSSSSSASSSHSSNWSSN